MAGRLEVSPFRHVLPNQAVGVFVGPVYTGRVAGDLIDLIDLIRRQAFRSNETVLFWHTGDESALHAYAQELLNGKADR